MEREGNKRGQMKISFGMIFSIILIIVFVAFAFYIIPKFFTWSDQAVTQKFYESLNNDVYSTWTSTFGSQTVEYNVPSSVKQVCFKNDQNGNVYFIEKTPVPGQFVDHLNITKSFCVNATKGKVDFVLEKNYGEGLVTVSSG